MGNYISACTLTIIPKSNTTTTTTAAAAATVIFPTGDTRRFHHSVNAAEVMLECPNFFLVNAQSLTINRRFSPLSADDDLDSGRVYVMFPMRRLNSVVTPPDMAVVWLSVSSAPKRIKGRISPEVAVTVEDVAEPPRVVVDSPEFGHRIFVSRSKKPGLDTIMEEPVCSNF